MAENELVARAQAAALEFTRNHICSATPWRGVGDLPRKVAGGHPYVGVNIPSLLGQLPEPSSPAVFGTYNQWAASDMHLKRGSKGLGFIYMKSFKKTDKGVQTLKEEGEELDVSDSGRVLVPYASFSTFAQCQLEEYNPRDHHPILETLKRQQMDKASLIASGRHALQAAERYMHDWMLSPNAIRRPMSEGERALVIHLAADLVVGFNAGSMQLAGELNPAYPEIAQLAIKAMDGKHIMRPWGIACDILRQLSPVFDASVRAGAEATQAAQAAYRKKYEAPATNPLPEVEKAVGGGSGASGAVSSAVMSVDATTVSFSDDW